MAKHYVVINENGVVQRGFSDDFEIPGAGDICVCDNGERHFEINGAVNPLMYDNNGIPLYKLMNGKITERAEEERVPVFIKSTPTLEERTSALESALLEIILGAQ